MTRSRVYRDGRLETEDFAPDRLAAELADPDTIVWLDMAEPSSVLGLPQTWHGSLATLQAAGFEVRDHCHGDLEAVRPPVADTAARILREATHNVIKHGQIGRAHV